MMTNVKLVRIDKEIKEIMPNTAIKQQQEMNYSINPKFLTYSPNQ